jgi:hypothetical protein
MIERTEERFGLKPERRRGYRLRGGSDAELAGRATYPCVRQVEAGRWPRGATFDMTRPVTFITVRAESGLGPAVLCTRARPVCIAQASSTAMHVRSNRSAAQRNHHARSRAISMSMLETLPGRWPAPRASSGSGMSGKKIEMRFAHLKRILMLDRLRLRGPRGAQDEFCAGGHRSEPAAARSAGCANATRSCPCVSRSGGRARPAGGSKPIALRNSRTTSVGCRRFCNKIRHFRTYEGQSYLIRL